MGTRVILLRHGQSTYNALGLYQGCCDESVLTEVGCQTAREAGAFLQGIKFDAVYTSPLKRAQETTRQVLATMKLGVKPQHIQVVSGLKETDLPAWQGVAFQKVREQFAQEYLCWKQTPDQFSMQVVQDGIQKPFYPALDLYARLNQFWQEILPRHRNQTLLLVAHGGTNRAAIATAMGIRPSYYHTIQQSNCALNILHFPTKEISSAQLEAVNLATHKEETLPQLKEGGKGIRLLLVPAQDNEQKQNQQLASLLQNVPIQFSLNNSQNLTQKTLEAIVETHPETVSFQSLRQDFSDIWPQALGQKISAHKLTTGLVVAPKESIASFLGQVIGMEKEQSWRLQLQPGTLSAVHYPATEHPPILQAMNISGTINPKDPEVQSKIKILPSKIRATASFNNQALK